MGLEIGSESRSAKIETGDVAFLMAECPWPTPPYALARILRRAYFLKRLL